MTIWYPTKTRWFACKTVYINGNRHFISAYIEDKQGVYGRHYFRWSDNEPLALSIPNNSKQMNQGAIIDEDTP